jgi:GTP pyrophosphokinase
MDNLTVCYSHSCQPVPGDTVTGYITNRRGISVHRTDCPNLLQLADHLERRVDIEWESERGSASPTPTSAARTSRRTTRG